IWFIDNSPDAVANSANLGTQNDPFTSIAAFNLANDGGTGHPGAGDIVYLRHGTGTGTYEESDGINLLDGQTLIGQGQDLVVNGGTIESGDPSLTPTIKLIAGDTDDGIDLAQNNTISGLNVDTTGGSGIGIDDNGHSVGTLSMSDISVSTSTGAGILIDQGGTVTVTGAGNTINSTSATALNVANTTIGSAGLTFQSISAGNNTAAADPTNGIVLNNTGSSGGLTVTGIGTTAGSGGTIQNNVQGALFTSTSNLSLSNMNFINPNSGEGTVNNIDNPIFNSAAQAGINMSGVSTVTFTNLNMNGNGGSGG